MSEAFVTQNWSACRISGAFIHEIISKLHIYGLENELGKENIGIKRINSRKINSASHLDVCASVRMRNENKSEQLFYYKDSDSSAACCGRGQFFGHTHSTGWSTLSDVVHRNALLIIRINVVKQQLEPCRVDALDL